MQNTGKRNIPKNAPKEKAPNRKLLVTVLMAAGVVLVGATAYAIITSDKSEFVLAPGFKRKSITFVPSLSEKIREKCFKKDLRGVTYFSTNDSLYRHKKAHTINIKEDFNSPITITVRANKLDGIRVKQPDPVIVIRNSNGDMLICDDIHGDHGLVETLNTDDSLNSSKYLIKGKGKGNLPGFKPRRGKYLLEIWSYFNPAKTYEITIEEDR